jgi:hypothetical protein
MRALVHAPIGRSVSIGCAGWPSQVPASRSLVRPGRTTLENARLSFLPTESNGLARSILSVSDSVHIACSFRLGPCAAASQAA